MAIRLEASRLTRRHWALTSKAAPRDDPDGAGVCPGTSHPGEILALVSGSSTETLGDTTPLPQPGIVRTVFLQGWSGLWVADEGAGS